ncbi:hypothetical protein Tco_0711173, partial [Tanacetum coccineum]
TKVSDSFEDDDGYSKKKMAAEKNETPKESVDKKENSKWCDYKNEAVGSKKKEVNIQHSDRITKMNIGSCELAELNKNMNVGPVVNEECIGHVETKCGLCGDKLNTQDFGLGGMKMCK